MICYGLTSPQPVSLPELFIAENSVHKQNVEHGAPKDTNNSDASTEQHLSCHRRPVTAALGDPIWRWAMLWDPAEGPLELTFA